jgi:8-oxo-dGTP pyrophosphatase MutT (NUDIX family)
VFAFRYEQVAEAPNGVFRGVSDRFNGITVDSMLEACDGDKFEDTLLDSLDHWTESRKRGIWFKVHLPHTAWVPVLAKHNFIFHHAKNNYVMMYRWLPPNEVANIPPYAHTMVGVGAVVMNDHNQVLVVSEKNALVAGSWKLPGGYVEPSEDLVDAAIREVMEETSIKTKFETVISVRHAHGTGFGCSDMYVVMALSPESSEVSKCDREIERCEWMDVEEYLKHPKVHETNRNFVNTYLHYKQNGVKITCREEVHQILKKKYNMYRAEVEASVVQRTSKM